jgi:succinate-acetate transporter protein
MINPGLTAIIEGNQVTVHYPLLQDGSKPVDGNRKTICFAFIGFALFSFVLFCFVLVCQLMKAAKLLLSFVLFYPALFFFVLFCSALISFDLSLFSRSHFSVLKHDHGNLL